MRSLRLTAAGARLVRQAVEGSAITGKPALTLLNRLCRANLLTAPTLPPSDSSDVTLVIPARSDAASVQRVLDSAPEVPAVVVDDGSAVPLEGRLHHSAPLTVVRHDLSRGPAAARNSGARLAATSLVAFCDADVIAPAGWIGALVPYVDGIFAVAPRIVAGGGDASHAAHGLETGAGALDMGEHPGYVVPEGSPSYVPSTALVVDRRMLLDAGGFDESLRVGEDVDLIWRTASQGIRYEPSVVLQHRPRATALQVLRRRADYGYSAGDLHDRHPMLMHHGRFPVTASAGWLLAMMGLRRTALAATVTALLNAPRAMPGLPAPQAMRVMALGQARSAAGLSRVLVRPMWPLAVLLAVARPQLRARFALAAAVGLLSRGRTTDAGWRLLDDLAYSAGVWRAAVIRRDARLVLPVLQWRRRDG